MLKTTKEKKLSHWKRLVMLVQAEARLKDPKTNPWVSNTLISIAKSK